MINKLKRDCDDQSQVNTPWHVTVGKLSTTGLRNHYGEQYNRG